MKIDIYKIYNDDMAYIGSSKNFKKRMDCHKSNCNNENLKAYNCFIYQYIRQHGGWDAFTKEIIHTCEVADETEQRMVEQEWINKNECKLNDRRSYITEEDRIQRDKKAYKKWFEQNKEHILELKKQWNEKNKEKIKEYKKKWYDDNKERYKEQNKQKTTCECGSVFRKSDKAQHERTKKHIQFMETK